MDHLAVTIACARGHFSPSLIQYLDCSLIAAGSTKSALASMLVAAINSCHRIFASAGILVLTTPGCRGVVACPFGLDGGGRFDDVSKQCAPRPGWNIRNRMPSWAPASTRRHVRVMGFGHRRRETRASEERLLRTGCAAFRRRDECCIRQWVLGLARGLN